MDERPGSLDLVAVSCSEQGILEIQFRKLELRSGESGSPADSGVLSAIEEHLHVSAGSLNRPQEVRGYSERRKKRRELTGKEATIVVPSGSHWCDVTHYVNKPVFGV